MFKSHGLYQELRRAIERRDASAVRELLSRGAPADPPWWARVSSGSRRPPLVSAAMLGAGEIASLLLDAGADPNGKRAWKAVPLCAASSAGHIDIVELLLQRGANVNGRLKYGSSALQEAAYASKIDVVRRLLEHGADPDFVLSKDISSLIRVRGPIIRLLIDAGGHPSETLEEMLNGSHLLG